MYKQVVKMNLFNRTVFGYCIGIQNLWRKETSTTDKNGTNNGQCSVKSFNKEIIRIISLFVIYDSIGSLTSQANEPNPHPEPTSYCSPVFELNLPLITLSKLYDQMDQKYGKYVYLTRTFWVYNLIFVRNHTNEQTFLSQSILYGNSCHIMY